MDEHVNSEGERITIQKVGGGSAFTGKEILVIHDDPPPEGSGRGAPMLLDDGTADWLLDQLADRRGVRVLPKAEWEQLSERLDWLDCLEGAGVDNWPGIEEAVAMFQEDD